MRCARRLRAWRWRGQQPPARRWRRGRAAAGACGARRKAAAEQDALAAELARVRAEVERVAGELRAEEGLELEVSLQLVVAESAARVRRCGRSWLQPLSHPLHLSPPLHFAVDQPSPLALLPALTRPNRAYIHAKIVH
jgi:hypothetical protein